MDDTDSHPQIHLSKPSAPAEDPKLVSKAVKLMHRFTPEEVQEKMDQVEKEKEKGGA